MENTKKSVFETLNSVNVNNHTEQKNGLTYLSWAWAWGTLKTYYPNATYKVYENELGYNYFNDGRTAWVKTGVEVEGIEYIEYLPIMDFKNNSIPLEKITSFDVNKAIQRSLTKAVARHGLGLYVYAGEDLPQEEQKKVDTQQIQEVERIAKEGNIDLDKLAIHLQKDKTEITKQELLDAIKQKQEMLERKKAQLEKQLEKK